MMDERTSPARRVARSAGHIPGAPGKLLSKRQTRRSRGRVLLGAIALAACCLAALSAPAAQANPDPPGTVYVADLTANAIDIYAPVAAHAGKLTGPPLRRIVGLPTGIHEPADVAVNSAGDVFVSNSKIGESSITEYAPGAGANATPIDTIAGSNTKLAENDDIALATDGEIYVGNFQGTAPVEVFKAGASGNEAPIRVLAGSLTGLGFRSNNGQTDGVGVDASGAVYTATPYGQTLRKFKPGASGNEAPEYSITGAATLLERPDDVKVAFDGELFVTSQGVYPSGNEGSIQVFAPGANGNVAPKRDIAGNKTKLFATDDEAVSPTGRIYATNDCGGPPCTDGNVGIFGPTQEGNEEPEAEIVAATAEHSQTELQRPEGVAIALPTSEGTLTTTASGTSISVGGSTHDEANLAGANSPTGQLVFKLFGPSDPRCGEPPAYVSPLITVTGNKTYESPSFTPSKPGTYYWVAEYSGDANNPPLATPCIDASEKVTVAELTWFSNGQALAPGVNAQTISWGTLTFTGIGGSYTCKKSDAGNIWNEGGIPRDDTVLFDLYECKGKSECPVEPEIVAEGLPWHSELQVVEGVIRDRTTGIRIKIRCGEFFAATYAGELWPKFVNMPGAAQPTYDEFGEGSGELQELEGKGTLQVTGTDKMLGFEEGDEIINAEEVEFPGIGRCVKTTTKLAGRYTSAGCESAELTTGGSYEWKPGAVKNKFTSTESTTTIDYTTKKKVTCKSATDAGEYDGESEDRETMTLLGCTSGTVGKETISCTSPGAEIGEIHTAPLRSLYGFLKRPKTIGVSLEAVRGNFMEFTCGGESVVIRGSLIAALSPVGKMVTTFSEKFKILSGAQEYQKFEGQPTDILEASVNSGAFHAAPFSSTDTITNEEPLEVRAAR